MKRKKVLKIFVGVIGSLFAVLSILTKKTKQDSNYNNSLEEKNPMEGKQVIFVEDEQDEENADGVRGHLEAIGESSYHPGFYENYMKRPIDIVLSFLGLIILSPVFIIISLAIVIEDPGPVLFTQKRIGQNKQYFKLHKFRSMKVSTPHDVPTHMLDDPDQYITKVGKFIRAHSLDELPQIWDIFMGNMSVIGPRPALWNQDLLTSERDKYGANDVKPGLTGWAQINGRDELEIPEKAKLDGEYVEKIGFSFDVKCFFKSIGVLSHDNSVIEGKRNTLNENKNKENGEKNMRKIAIVSFVAALPGEKGINRMYFLADLLQRNGYEVDFVTSNFQHWEKKQRPVDYDVESLACKVTFLPQPSYKKNIEVKRILSYRILAKNIEKYLEGKEFDLVYCSIPDNHIAAVCGKYAKRKGIPYIVDVEDLWPEAMKMVLNIPVITDILYKYFEIDAKIAYKLADGVIGSSDTYRDEPKKYGINVKHCMTIYVGTDISLFDEGVKINSDKVEKIESEFWVSYAGTLGSSYDIETLVRAADIIKKRGFSNIKIKILGDGPLKEKFQEVARGLSGEVEFLGYQQYQMMAAYLSKSEITINSIVHGAAQSIVSKIGDYLAAESAMINTCEDLEFWKKVENDGFGVNVTPGQPEQLAEVIINLYLDKDKTANMAKIAREIGEQQFDREKSYMNIVRMIDNFVGK